MALYINGKEVFAETIFTGTTNVLDNQRFTLGSDNDNVLVHHTGTLAANTTLTNVLEGTPVTPAIAANTLIVSNVTNDGDILIAASDGGNSIASFFFDASAPDTYLYKVGGTWTAGTTTWSIPAFTAAGAITADSNIILSSGYVQYQGTNSFYVGDGSNVRTLTWQAWDGDGSTWAAVGKIVGADDPYFALGGGGELKAYNSGKLEIGSAKTLEGAGTGANGFILKNLKNAAASALSGTQLDIEIDLGGTPYYFTVYPSKA